jgi:hypothetical protein
MGQTNRKEIQKSTSFTCSIHPNDPNTANILLRDGFITGKTKLPPWKEKCEPICCIKYQNYGHNNICTSCSEGHKSDEYDNNTQLFCVRCKCIEYSSKDLLCLTYQRKQDETSAKYLENLMPFYPMHEAWT